MTNDKRHYVIIGHGAAGNEAARCLRQRDPGSRITVITAGKLLFLNRYQLPRIFDGIEDWREFLVHPPAYYDEQHIIVRRNIQVSRVEPEQRALILHHKEEISYDKLLVASGGGGYLPEDLREYRCLLHDFTTFENAMRMRGALPAGGKAVILGGDIRGLDLARNLIRTGHEVIIAANEQLFWPHEVPSEKRSQYISALENMGMQVILDRKIVQIEEGAKGIRGRRILLDNGQELHSDVVMAFCGLMPALPFMLNSGIDIERGLLVNPGLRTVNEHIWAAGDVCQIWSPEENRYRFYYGWKNVMNMGRIAAINMTGGNEAINTFQEDELFINENGEIGSSFWEYE